jgi:hypothetical protein
MPSKPLPCSSAARSFVVASSDLLFPGEVIRAAFEAGAEVQL